MLFQILDDKQECAAIFVDDKIENDYTTKNLSRTWKYTKHFENEEGIKYANLYCHGKNLEEMCPSSLRDRWDSSNNKMRAFLRSFRESKISLEDNCFFDLVPKKALIEYLEMKNKITDRVFETYEEPENYEFLLSLCRVIENIKYRKLNLNTAFKYNKIHFEKIRRLNKKLLKLQPFIKYNIFGTKTGRLSTFKNSFPILNLDKDVRGVIEPVNDLFLELDFNATELRILLALLNKEQPEEDLHEWNAKTVYRGLQDREEAKKRIFAWLYNPESKDYLSEKFYDRALLKKKYYKSGKIVNPYGREIESDDHHAVNYLIQSTASDLFLRQMVKIYNFLQDKKSFISFTIHDSIVIDTSSEDKKDIEEIVNLFQNTEFGKFKTNIKMGKNFGDMKEVSL